MGFSVNVSNILVFVIMLIGLSVLFERIDHEISRAELDGNRILSKEG
jgi:archaellum component FlaF (FlaF/FlaG flagellin family)